MGQGWGLALPQSLGTERIGRNRSAGLSALPLWEGSQSPASPPLPGQGKDAVMSRATQGSRSMSGPFRSWSVQNGDRDKGQSRRDKVGLAEGKSLR